MSSSLSFTRAIRTTPGLSTRRSPSSRSSARFGGRWLVELILEELEAEGSPYKYVVTQATDGSIAFYEKLGFVRVGALTAKKREVLTSPGGGEGASGDAASAGKKRKSMTPAVPKSKFVSSPHLVYKTETSEETIDGVAAKYNVDVKDLIFLNLSKHSKLVPGCTLRKEMKLLSPQLPTVEDVKKEMVATHQQFYEVPDDMPFQAHRGDPKHRREGATAYERSHEGPTAHLGGESGHAAAHKHPGAHL